MAKIHTLVEMSLIRISPPHTHPHPKAPQTLCKSGLGWAKSQNWILGFVHFSSEKKIFFVLFKVWIWARTWWDPCWAVSLLSMISASNFSLCKNITILVVMILPYIFFFTRVYTYIRYKKTIKIRQLVQRLIVI